MTSKVPQAHLSGFLALAGYGSRKRIVDSERHLSSEIEVNSFEKSGV